MRIAAIADVHGNLDALEAVLRDIAPRRPDVILNLGDTISGPLYPLETAELLMPLGLPTIRGNHERQLLEMNRDEMGPSDRCAHDAIGARERRWIGSLPPTLWLNADVFLCHGTPASDLEYFLEHVSQSGAEPAGEALLRERAGGCRASLIFCGHTHIPRVVRLDEHTTIVNPGSVGLQAFRDDHPHPHTMETGSPDARYAIVDRTNGGWRPSLLAVSYDWQRASDLARARGQTDWATALRYGTLSGA